jgi:hypothetical protein
MATIVKAPLGLWKAHVRKKGWPAVAKSFRIKRDAQDWARQVEDEMVRGTHIVRSEGASLMFADAIDRYLREVSSAKSPNTQKAEGYRAVPMRAFFGHYSMNTVTSKLVAEYRDQRFADGCKPDTVRLDLAMLGHLFTIAIKEWRLGLPANPVANVRDATVFVA